MSRGDACIHAGHGTFLFLDPALYLCDQSTVQNQDGSDAVREANCSGRGYLSAKRTGERGGGGFGLHVHECKEQHQPADFDAHMHARVLLQPCPALVKVVVFTVLAVEP